MKEKTKYDSLTAGQCKGRWLLHRRSNWLPVVCSASVKVHFSFLFLRLSFFLYSGKEIPIEKKTFPDWGINMNRWQLGELATQLNVWWIPSGTGEIFSVAFIEIMRVRDIVSLNFRSIIYEIFIFAATFESNEATNTLFLYNYIYKKNLIHNELTIRQGEHKLHILRLIWQLCNFSFIDKK